MADGKVVFEIQAETGDFDKAVSQLGDNAAKAASKGMSEAADAAGKAGGSISTRLGSIFSGIGSKVSGVFSGISSKLGGFSEAAGKVFSGIGTVAGKALSGLGSLAGKALSSAVGIARNALSTIASLAAKTGAAIAAGIGAGLAYVGRLAISAYGDFEQLSGGIQLALGDQVWATVEERSRNAFSRMQISQNDYLEQVNLMATGLREALGGDQQAAADLADRVIESQANIVSAMGVSQESVQNAFNGIMRGNYTMLDSLGIGLSGTKESMQMVIDKMNEWNATQSDRTATNYSIDNLADCQAALADYTEYLGLAGYAAEEGAATIQGSISKMKAAWTDWTAELAKPDADMARVSENLATSIQEAAGNIVPAFASAIGNAASQLPGILQTLAPTLADGITTTIATALGIDAGGDEEAAGNRALSIVMAICSKLLQNAPSVLDSASETLSGILDAANEMAPTVSYTIATLLADLIAKIVEDTPAMLESAGEFFGTFINALGERAPKILSDIGGLLANLIKGVADNVPGMLDRVGAFFQTFLTSISQKAPDIFSALVSLLLNLIKELPARLPSMLSAALEFIGGILSAIWQQMPSILAGLATTLGELIGLVIGGIAEMVSAGIEFIGGLLKGTEDGSSPLQEWFRNLPMMLFEAMGDILSFFFNIGSNIVQGIINGISAVGGNIASTLAGYAQGAFDTVCGWLGIASPSKLFRDKVGKMIVLGVTEGVEDEQRSFDRALGRALSIDGALSDLDSKLGSWSYTGMLASPSLGFGAAPAYAGAGIATAATIGYASSSASRQPASDLGGKLDRILAAVEAGQVIEVDSRVLGRTVRKAI